LHAVNFFTQTWDEGKNLTAKILNTHHPVCQSMAKGLTGLRVGATEAQLD